MRKRDSRKKRRAKKRRKDSTESLNRLPKSKDAESLGKPRWIIMLKKKPSQLRNLHKAMLNQSSSQMISNKWFILQRTRQLRL